MHHRTLSSSFRSDTPSDQAPTPPPDDGMDRNWVLAARGWLSGPSTRHRR